MLNIADTKRTFFFQFASASQENKDKLTVTVYLRCSNNRSL